MPQGTQQGARARLAKAAKSEDKALSPSGKPLPEASVFDAAQGVFSARPVSMFTKAPSPSPSPSSSSPVECGAGKQPGPELVKKKKKEVAPVRRISN